jgi:hypothetical protein
MITAKLPRDLEEAQQQIRQVVEIHLPRKETASPVLVVSYLKTTAIPARLGVAIRSGRNS